MALIRCDFRSEVLELGTSMTVLIPEGPRPARGWPTLYLLHGLSDDDTAWVRQTAIERYTKELGLAVVMPQVHRSYYSNEAHGLDYWTFLTVELPELAEGMFTLTQDPNHRYVAGLSMGGYGAVKWALREPGRFRAAASMSGALGLARRTAQGEGRLDARLWDTIFDSRSIEGTVDDVRWLVGDGDAADVPPLYVCCGTEDALYEENVAFVETARGNDVSIAVDFGPGAHTWDYWDARLRDVLAWLPRDER